jgi:site-specific recombinase
LTHADRARHVTLLGLLDAIRTLSCRVCALGLEPRLIHAHMEIEEVDSPFLMQNIEANTTSTSTAACWPARSSAWKTRATCWSCSTSARRWC